MEAKRGRPSLPVDERAEERLELRIKSADKGAWQESASQAGLSLSAWIRDRLNKAAKRNTR